MSSPSTSQRAEPTCAEIEALLPLVADGALDAAADPLLFTHLAECTACQEALAGHDLITLAIGQSAATTPRLAVIHLRLPRLVAWASAAALIIGLAGAALWLRDAVPAAPLVADREVIRVNVPGSPESGYYLIREGEHWQRVDPGRFDGDQQADASNPAGESTPVGYRY